MPVGQLIYKGWRQLTTCYPEPGVVEAILGICQYGARIGYEGNRGPVKIYRNLSSAKDTPEIVTTDIAAEVDKNRLHPSNMYQAVLSQSDISSYPKTTI